MSNDDDDDDDSSYNSLEDFLGCSIDRFQPNNAVTCIVCQRKGLGGDFVEHNICFRCHPQIFEEGLDEETKEEIVQELRLVQTESPAATSTTTSAASVDKSNSNGLCNILSLYPPTPMATKAKQQQPKRKTLQNPKKPAIFVPAAAIKKEPPVAVASGGKWAIKPIATKKAPPPVLVNPYAKKKKPVAVKPHSTLSKAKSSVRSIGRKGQNQFVMYG
jgi:hypothetical protein